MSNTFLFTSESVGEGHPGMSTLLSLSSTFIPIPVPIVVCYYFKRQSEYIAIVHGNRAEPNLHMQQPHPKRLLFHRYHNKQQQTAAATTRTTSAVDYSPWEKQKKIDKDEKHESGVCWFVTHTPFTLYSPPSLSDHNKKTWWARSTL